MRIIISPAKKMNVDTDSFACRGLPALLNKTEQLYGRMRGMSFQELKTLWKCNDQIAQLNAGRLLDMDLRRNLTPAILAYQGIQYRYMAPGVFTEEELEYVEEHLRILSGFYGVLRPFDGVTPYRLEMQAKISEKGTQCKMVRGEMVRCMAQYQVQEPEDIAFPQRIPAKMFTRLSGSQEGESA